MSKIIEYSAVLADHPDELTREVNALINKGFQPLGGICAIKKEDQPYVLQAVVKYAEPPE
jgi:Domain of unknown function (DUF1737)